MASFRRQIRANQAVSNSKILILEAIGNVNYFHLGKNSPKETGTSVTVDLSKERVAQKWRQKDTVKKKAPTVNHDKCLFYLVELRGIEPLTS